MERLLALSFALLPVAWTAAAVAYAGALLGDRGAASRACRPLALLAVVLHSGTFGLLIAAGVPPVASAGGLVSAIGLATAVVYLWLEGRIGSRVTGVFPVGAAALLSAVGNGLGDPLVSLSPELESTVTALHVAGAVLAYAALLLAAEFGALYLAQRRSIRNHRPGKLTGRLPPLELLDQYCRGSLLAAAAFLTVLIAFGHAVRFSTPANEPYADPKVLATNGLWVIVVLVAVGLKTRRISARAGAWTAMALLLAAVGNLAVINALSTWHGIR